MNTKKVGMTFSPTVTKSRNYCSVHGCSKRASTNIDIRFHSFPRKGAFLVNLENKFGSCEKVDKLLAWKKVLKIGEPISPYMRVCSLHFKKEDYIFPDVPAKRRVLKISAIPSCNLPVNSFDTSQKDDEKNSKRSERRVNRALKKETSLLEREKMVQIGKSNQILTSSSLDPSDPEISNIQGLDTKQPEEVHNEIGPQTAHVIPTTTADFGIQVRRGDLIMSFREFIKTDKDLSTATGIESFQILDAIVNIVRLVDKEDPRSKIDLEGKTILTFVKLKQNLSYAFLAVLSGCYTGQTCKTIFYHMLDILGECLKFAIHWPSKAEISKNLPTCFQNFKNVRVVLDCTEVFIQKPKKFCCELLTYSHYKGTNTVKIMTGVTPAGLISFISKPYGGRVSDKAIFEQSGLIQLVERNDAILVDKGFLIDDICQNNDIELIRPPFLRNQTQFAKSDALLTAEIAKARVHIERSNQRLKTFKIMGSKMPVALAKKSESIFTIVSVLVNLSSPILKDDKFFK